MKKWISFLIALCMLFGAAIPVFSDETDSEATDNGEIDKDIVKLQPVFSGGARADSDVYSDISFEYPLFLYDIVDEELKDKAQVLCDIGIIDTIDRTKEITRGQFVAMALKIADITPIEAGNTRYFDDVDRDTAYCNEITTAASMGFISGQEGMFYPESPISFNESISILMKVIGYGTLSELKGGYPNGYLQTARQSGVLADSPGSETEHLNAKTVIDLLYDTLFASVMDQVSFSNTEVSYAEKHNVLSFYHNIYVVKGQVTANKISSFKNMSKTDNCKICIDDRTYNIEKEDKYIDYFGYHVEAFVKKPDTANTIISMVKDRNLKEYIISAEDIDDYSDCTYHYDNDKTKQVSPNHTFILNGIRQVDYTEDRFVPKNGEVKLLYYNNSPAADVVIVNEFQPFLLNQFKGNDDNKLEFISVDKGVKFFIEPDNSEQTVEYYLDGLKFDPNSQYVILKDADGVDYRQNILPKIPTPSILNVFADKYTDVNGVKIPSEEATYIKIYITPSSVEGNINVVNDADDKVVIGEDTYTLASRNLLFIEKTEFAPGKSGKFFLDYDNHITAWIADIPDKNTYGYLIRCAKEERSFNDCILNLKIMNSSGEINVYRCKDKVKVNDVLMKDMKQVYNMLVTAAAYVHSDNRISQLIRFEANEDYEVTSLFVVDKPLGDGKTEECVTRNCEKQSLLSRSENTNSLYTPAGIVCYNPGCKTMFSVPESESADESDYYMLGKWGEDRLARTVEVYDTNEYLVPGAVVVYRKPKEELSIPYFMVESVTRQLNENGDEVAVINGTNGNNWLVASYIADDISLFDNLKCGDFIRLYGKNDIVTDYELLMSVDTVKNFDYSTPFASSSAQIMDLFELHSVYNNGFLILQRGEVTDNGVRAHQQCVQFVKNQNRHFIYDASEGKEPRIDYFYNPEYLDTALNDGVGKASKVFVFTSGSVTKFIVVYKGI